jgi:hypothetical protein
MLRHPTRILTLLALFGLLLANSAALACPFCSAVSQTFTEEIGSMDVVVVATLIGEGAASSTSDDPNDSGTARFRITKVIKGAPHLGKQKTLETVYFGQAGQGDQFLIMAVDPPKLAWSTPLRISDRGVDYVQKILTLPKSGVERLEFFQRYLEDEEDLLARDAYDEFAKAPYETVIALKDKMNHDQLVAWVEDTDIPASRRRLYLTMLGVCGKPSDLPMLENLLTSDDRKAKAGLDALIACYLTLRGAEGLPLVEKLFLGNKDAEYADTYATIMALRFHGTETDVIPRERILKSLHLMLQRPKLADLVIPDLARWEDWSQMERLVTLFKEADEESSWVRVPVINYLRACPLPKAETYIKELERVDPAAVKRANTFFPLARPTPSGDT